MKKICLGLMGSLFLFSVPAVHAAEFRFLVATQYNWSQNRGFYLGFESGAEKPPCTIEGLKMSFFAGNGKRFFYTFAKRPWQPERVYSVKAVVNNKDKVLELWVDGKLSEKTGGEFIPEAGPMKMNLTTDEYPGPANFFFVPIAMKITSGGKVFCDDTFKSANRPFPSMAINPYRSDACREIEFKPRPGDDLVIETKIKILLSSRIADYAPFVDKYYQWCYGDWPGKVTSDDQLKQRLREERERLKSKSWAVSPEYDKYGGFIKAGWKEKATGFFRLTQRNGYYWLVSPEGHPCFYTGFCGVGLDADNRWPPTPVTGREKFFEWLPPREGPFARAWMIDAWGQKGVNYVLPIAVNSIRKYGQNWEREKNLITYQRMKAWGFSGGGKWARQNPEEIAFAWMPVLNGGDTPCLVGRADIFDPKVREIFEKNLRTQCESYRDNPWLVGLSYGNEDNQMVFADEIKTILAMKNNPPAKRALIDYAIKTLYKDRVTELAKAWNIQPASTVEAVYAAAGQVPDRDLDELRLFYLDRYHEFIYRTIKKHDPNHLYFGSWIPGWRVIWGYPKDWLVMAKHCDVLGYDHYDMNFLRPEFKARVDEAKKPILCGEFGWAPFYEGKRGFAPWYWEINSDAETGKLYQKWITDAATNPYCVGVFYFEHYDASCLGRGPGKGPELQFGEALAWGLVDCTDTPKWDLVKSVRETNLQATPIRLKAANMPCLKP